MDYIRVYKHIYRLEPGAFAALFKAGTLISTEEVFLHPSKTLREEWEGFEELHLLYLEDIEEDSEDAILMTTKEGDECLFCTGKGWCSDEEICVYCHGEGRYRQTPRFWGDAKKGSKRLYSAKDQRVNEIFEEYNAIGFLVEWPYGMD